MSYLKLVALSVLLAACSNADESTQNQTHSETPSKNQNTAIDTNKSSQNQTQTSEHDQKDDKNQLNDVADDLYAQLPPVHRSRRELPEDSACQNLNQYLLIQSEITEQTDEQVTYQITATNQSAFPIKMAGGAIEIKDTTKNWYACDSVAWGFEKEDGSSINPGESVTDIFKTGKKFRCSTEFIKNPTDGFVLHYSQGYFMLPDDSKLTPPFGVNC